MDKINGVNLTEQNTWNPPVEDELTTYPQKMPIEAQDKNDGKQDGNQPSFSMPPFANGRDMRPGR